jgi:hypothetical protein
MDTIAIVTVYLYSSSYEEIVTELPMRVEVLMFFGGIRICLIPVCFSTLRGQ